MEEIVKRGTYNDADYTIVRTDEHQNAGGSYEYEFVLSIEGEAVTNAGARETGGAL